MGVLEGFKKIKKYVLKEDGYHLLSHWTSSNTVEMNNGNTLEEKMTSIDNTLDNMISDWSMNESTGVITVTKLNGDKFSFDLNIEKVPIDFTLNEYGVLTMTTEDGTKFTADISKIIPDTTTNIIFENSNSINVVEKERDKILVVENFVEYTHTFDKPYTGKIEITTEIFDTETDLFVAEIMMNDGTKDVWSSVGVGGTYFKDLENAVSIYVSSDNTENIVSFYIEDVSKKTYSFELANELHEVAISGDYNDLINVPDVNEKILNTLDEVEATTEENLLAGALAVKELSAEVDTANTNISNLTSSKTKNYVYAAPSSAAGTPTFRALTSTDIPTLAASKISSGTFASTAVYAKTGTDYTTARIRNIKASTTDLTAGTSTLSSGDIYVVYE